MYHTPAFFSAFYLRRRTPLILGLATLAVLPHAAQAAPYTVGAANPSQTIGYDGVIDTLIVDTTGTYDITVVGADGGAGYNAFYNTLIPGGAGASASGDIDLTAGTLLDVVAGGAGQSGLAGSAATGGGNFAGGGGGGSFVFLPGAPQPLLVAGGGGGSYASGTYAGSAGQDGTVGAMGDSPEAGAGGANGSGGGGGTFVDGQNGGGGGGYSGNGGAGGIIRAQPGESGDGGQGGPSVSATPFAGGVGADGYGGGGFGGGGGSGFISGGGGGGYSGGGGGDGDFASDGGGGGSYAGAASANVGFGTNGSASGNGSVTITFVPAAVSVPEASPGVLLVFGLLPLGAWKAVRARRKA